MSCEDVEGLEGAFARGSLDKVLENLPSLDLLLIFVFAHVSGAVRGSGAQRMEQGTMKYPEKCYACKVVGAEVSYQGGLGMGAGGTGKSPLRY